jgi:hypothetical protein
MQLRTGVAVALLVAAALAPLPPTAARIQRLIAEMPPEGDTLTRFARRLVPVREQLQTRLARVGYLPPVEMRRDVHQITVSAHFLYTRYALAPVQLLPQWDVGFVLADLRFQTRPSIPAWLEVDTNFGDGLLLLRRREPPPESALR